MLRMLLECLGKFDKRREERDQSGQEPHEINQIGHFMSARAPILTAMQPLM